MQLASFSQKGKFLLKGFQLRHIFPNENRLSQDSKVNVAVLEAGFFAEQPKTLVPGEKSDGIDQWQSELTSIVAIYAGFIGDPNLDWGFVTTPQKYASNSVIILPRGKVR